MHLVDAGTLVLAVQILLIAEAVAVPLLFVALIGARRARRARAERAAASLRAVVRLYIAQEQDAEHRASQRRSGARITAP
jgi:hypothetical protein